MSELTTESGESEEQIKAEIARMIVEMQRLHEQMQRDHALGQQLQAETDATMARVHEGLADLRAARLNYVAPSFGLV